MMDEETIARMVGMKRAGFKNREIAARLGVTEQTVKRISRQIGAAKRHRGKMRLASQRGELT